MIHHPARTLHRAAYGAFLLPLATVATLSAQTWTGAGANSNWSTAANWSGGLAPANGGAAAVIFDGTSGLSSNLDAAWSVGTLTFSAGAGSFVIGSTGGHPLTLTTATATIANNSTSLQTFDADIVFGGNNLSQQILATNGSITINGDVSLGNNKLFLGSGSLTNVTTITINGDITGTRGGVLGALSTASRALDLGYLNTTIVLAGNNTFSGDVYNQRGTILLRSDTALGTAAGALVKVSATNTNAHAAILTDGAHAIDRDFVIGTGDAVAPARAALGGNSAHVSSFTGNITLGDASLRGRNLELTAAAGGSVTFSGNLLTYGTNNGDGITKTGAGTVILSGAGNNYKGTTTVSAGTLLINSAFAGAGAAISVAEGATLGGSGSLDRAINLASGATLLGGSGSASSALSINADVSFATGSIIRISLGESGTHSSLVRLGGAWSFATDQIFLFTGTTPGVYDNILSGLDTGSVSQAIVDSWTITGLASGLEGAFTFADGKLALTVSSSAIPEPSACAALAGVAILGLATSRRRRIR